MTGSAASRGGPGGRPRYAPGLAYQAARMYYLEDATQAEIATRIGMSRATVSRLLTEARDTGIVEIRLRNPRSGLTADLEQALIESLGLINAYVASDSPGVDPFTQLVPGVVDALAAAHLQSGDALLVSSGATIHAVAQHNLPDMDGVVLCPTVGGVEEPEPHYQTNEITRSLALRVKGIPVMLYAPAMPSPDLHDVLLRDPQIIHIQSLWANARAALLGVGAPPHGRGSLPSVIPAKSPAMRAAAGDICARPYGRDGRPIEFPGVERLIAITLEGLRRIPHTIAVAVGPDKLTSIRIAARAGYLNTLVTDRATAQQLVDMPTDGT